MPQGDRIGWIDYDAIYLEPTASYRIAQLMAHDAGEGLSVTLDAVERLMDGQKADMVFTDPPYNVDYEGYTEEKLKIEGDKMTPVQFQEFL